LGECQSVYGEVGRPTGWGFGQDAKRDKQKVIAKKLEQAILGEDREFALIEAALQEEGATWRIPSVQENAS